MDMLLTAIQSSKNCSAGCTKFITSEIWGAAWPPSVPWSRLSTPAATGWTGLLHAVGLHL